MTSASFEGSQRIIEDLIGHDCLSHFFQDSHVILLPLRLWGCLRDALGCFGDDFGDAFGMHWRCIEDAYGMHRGYFWDALEMHWEWIGGCIGGCFKDVLGVH